jgi:hypothetical protein
MVSDSLSSEQLLADTPTNVNDNHIPKARFIFPCIVTKPRQLQRNCSVQKFLWAAQYSAWKEPEYYNFLTSEVTRHLQAETLRVRFLGVFLTRFAF